MTRNTNRTNYKWMPHHEKFLKDNYKEMTDKELGDGLARIGLVGLTKFAIVNKRRELKLGKNSKIGEKPPKSSIEPI